MTAIDTFTRFSRDLESPATNGAAITPSDTVDLVTLPRCFSVLTGTVLRGTPADMADGTFLNYPVQPGVVYARRLKRIWATGTDCTGIVSEW